MALKDVLAERLSREDVSEPVCVAILYSGDRPGSDRTDLEAAIRSLTGKQVEFTHVSGSHFPDNITDYSLIVQCGGCMLNRKAMLSRISQATNANIPIVNYGVLIAYVQGILDRSLKPFPLASLERNERS